MISRADKIDGSGKAEGYYFYVPKYIEDRLGGTLVGYFIHNVNLPCEQINPSTLEHSFDDGKSWYSEENINRALFLVFRTFK